MIGAMRRTVLAPLVLAALALPAAPAHAKAKPCSLSGSRSVVESSTARIYSKVGTKGSFGATRRFYGCLFSANKRWSLGFDVLDDDGGIPFAYRHRLAGRFAAFLEAEGDDSGPQGGSVVRRDLKTGALLRYDEPGHLPSDPPASVFSTEIDYFQPVALVLRSDGDMAWIVNSGGITTDRCGSFGCRVMKSDGRGLASLDDGDGIEPDSLKLRGTTARWVRAGEARLGTLG
jgi:hypothetical protein